MIGQQDQELYDEVGAAFADVHLEQDAEGVIRRGRALRRRRRAMPALAAAGALAFSLSLATVAAHSPSSSRTTLVNVDEAGFSVHTDARTGAVTVTVRQLFDEAQLKSILAEAGVRTAFYSVTQPADRHVTRCVWEGVRVFEADGVVGPPHQAGGETALTIYPSKMPSGSVLGFSFYTLIGANGTTAGMMVAPRLLSGEPTGCVVKN